MEERVMAAPQAAPTATFTIQPPEPFDFAKPAILNRWAAAHWWAAEHHPVGRGVTLIRDRLVVGLKNTALSEKLQLERDLTLQSAIMKVRQSEEVRRQQSDLDAKEREKR
ncbi:hypothetical protein SKAU_G00098490 [Synaphobranchus kaupii]|uniref:Uncharacterized protein n=1 Tax=Synaphobranchus kaupii TaxID=118154 RepID=A0A9Q1FY34_SYNKA|nr:hypothetical protein SKAU_G00098490 [Synaphobranchus kaupii]